MKHYFLVFLLICIACAHQPLTVINPLVVVSKHSTHQATKEELTRSMQMAHFIESDKDDKQTDLYFATYEPSGLKAENSFYEFAPAIVIKRGEKTPAEFISWPELIKYGWVMAAQLPSRGYYWGFLDYQVEGLTSEVMILWSNDSGKNWSQLASLKKHSFNDEFESFNMDELGNGTATIKRLGAGVDGSIGFDIFTTLDFGKTWSAPVFHNSEINLINTFGNVCSFSMKPTKKIPKECAIPPDVKK